MIKMELRTSPKATLLCFLSLYGCRTGNLILDPGGRPLFCWHFLFRRGYILRVRQFRFRAQFRCLRCDSQKREVPQQSHSYGINFKVNLTQKKGMRGNNKTRVQIVTRKNKEEKKGRKQKMKAESKNKERHSCHCSTPPFVASSTAFAIAEPLTFSGATNRGASQRLHSRTVALGFLIAVSLMVSLRRKSEEHHPLSPQI